MASNYTLFGTSANMILFNPVKKDCFAIIFACTELQKKKKKKKKKKTRKRMQVNWE